MVNLCNVDGVVVPEREARIPVLDRGFLFGDSIYEVVATRGGIPFGFVEHLERLRSSAAGIRMEIGISDVELMRRTKQTMQAAANRENYVRIIVTRGVADAPNIDLRHAVGAPCIVVMVREWTPGPVAPVRLRIVERLRNDRRALDPAVKSGNYLNNVMGLAEARAAGDGDAVFLNAAGHVTEASTSNVFAVIDGTVVTPPLTDGLLAGITRQLVIDASREAGIAVVERSIGADELRASDEVFLSSTLRNVLPAIAVDGVAIGDGGTGAVTRRVAAAFDVAAARHKTEIDAPTWSSV
jgi:branched-chain amino acid aminotransferase